MPVMTVVSESLSRCHRLYIKSERKYPVIDGLMTLFDMIRSLSAPKLVFLDLDVEGIHLDSAELRRILDRTRGTQSMIEGGAPQLRYLRLGASIFNHSLPPMNHIAYLQVGYLSDPINFDIFRRLLVLQNLSFLQQKVPWNMFRIDVANNQCHMPCLVY